MSHGLGRRRLVAALVACAGVALGAASGALAGGAAAAATGQANPIVAENAQPGTPGWDQSPRAPAADVQGYTSAVGVAPGTQEQFHITGAAGVRYRIEIFRLGWYQGIGARLEQCLPSCSSDEAATFTPPTPAPDPVTGFLDAGWPVTDAVTMPGGAVSGIYLAKVLITAGPGAGSADDITFVVTEASPQSPILVQIGVNTEEAYNNWGGKSLYAYNSTGGVSAVEVSFDRPDAVPDWEFQWDYQLVRFLERNGYDVSYGTDVDTALGTDAPSARRLVIVAGHDEYWSKEIRDGLDAALAGGTNMAFMGANDGYWQMRYANNYRAIYEYRSATADPDPDPTNKTVLFRDLVPPRPECLLEGVQDAVNIHTGYAAPPSNRNYQVVSAALGNPWFAGTGLTASSVLSGLVGYEWDTANQPGCPPSQVLFTWSGLNGYGALSEADAATFTAASGARVFAAGSFQYSWGLDGYGHTALANTGLQVFTENMLNDLSAGATPPTATPPPSISGSTGTVGPVGSAPVPPGAAPAGSAVGVPAGSTGSSTVTTAPVGPVGSPGVGRRQRPPALAVSRALLTVLAAKRVRLSFDLQALRGGAGIKSVTIATPRGLGFSRSAIGLARGTRVRGPAHRRRRIRITVSRRELTITLKVAARSLELSVLAPAIVVAPRLARRIVAGDVRAVAIHLTDIDTAHSTIRISLTAATKINRPLRVAARRSNR